MLYSVVTDPASIRDAYDALCAVLETGAEPITCNVGDIYKRHNTAVYWQSHHGFWSLTRAWEPFGKNTYGCCYGVMHPRESGMKIHPTLETNILAEGVNSYTAGLILRDNAAAYCLAHTGNATGPVKGGGKRNFLRFYGQHESITYPNGTSRPLVVVGRIGSDDFLDRLSAYVKAVHEFKQTLRARAATA